MRKFVELRIDLQLRSISKQHSLFLLRLKTLTPAETNRTSLILQAEKQKEHSGNGVLTPYQHTLNRPLLCSACPYLQHFDVSAQQNPYFSADKELKEASVHFHLYNSHPIYVLSN